VRLPLGLRVPVDLPRRAVSITLDGQELLGKRTRVKLQAGVPHTLVVTCK
jgi:hypothetical protein